MRRFEDQPARPALTATPPPPTVPSEGVSALTNVLRNRPAPLSLTHRARRRGRSRRGQAAAAVLRGGVVMNVRAALEGTTP